MPNINVINKLGLNSNLKIFEYNNNNNTNTNNALTNKIPRSINGSATSRSPQSVSKSIQRIK